MNWEAREPSSKAGKQHSFFKRRDPNLFFFNHTLVRFFQHSQSEALCGAQKSISIVYTTHALVIYVWSGTAGRRASVTSRPAIRPDFYLKNRGHEGTARLSNHTIGRRLLLRPAYVFVHHINRPSVRCGPSAKLGRHLRSRFRCSMCSAVRMD